MYYVQDTPQSLCTDNEVVRGVKDLHLCAPNTEAIYSNLSFEKTAYR
jgi:hypothetical protein